MQSSRITIFSGHYGSGKTNIAVNYALALKKTGKKVAIYDLDVVNPYFRTVDAENLLKNAGVELIVSPFAETNVDIPAMNAASYKMVDDKESFAVIDLGGDDRGALALGRFSDGIKRENDYDNFLVVNPFRPETRDIQGLLGIKNEIERAGRIPFTGIVNNANLGNETDISVVRRGYDFCKAVSEKTGLKIAFTCVKADLVKSAKEVIKEVLPIELIKYGNW